MSHLLRALGLGTLLLATVAGVGISGDADKDKGTTKTPSIPTGWKALDLTKEQRDRVISIAVDYRAKIAALQKQIDDLKAQERAEQVKVLTGAQKAILLKGLADGDTERNRTDTVNHLKQIGLAVHSYNDVYKRLPPAYLASNKKRDGKPLLSWRVAILPFIEQEALYKKFDLDQPWDSPANKKLIAQMPAVYQRPGAAAKAGMTHFRTLVGPNTVFETIKGPDGAVRARGNLVTAMPDGTSNTIMVVEAREPTIWTRPDDLPFDPKGPLPRFGIGPEGFYALLGDGSVRFIRSTISEQTLRYALIPNDGNPLPADWNRDSIAPP